jgi:SAM-dependent methyltransferase
METNRPKFKAELYRDTRPLYPRSLFKGLEKCGIGPDCEFLDLGCGTGLSTRSFLDVGITTQGTAIDPDPGMLEIARSSIGQEYPNLKCEIGSAEAIPSADSAFDLVLVGSAIHWFEVEPARKEIERVLKKGGLLFVFEYQFPKCVDHDELAEKVRRGFNLEWKAPVQRPRGTLADLVQPYVDSGSWSLLSDEKPSWQEPLSLESFLGHLYSQSRFLHAEGAKTNPELYRKGIAEGFAPYFKNGSRTFDFKPRAIKLRKKP